MNKYISFYGYESEILSKAISKAPPPKILR